MFICLAKAWINSKFWQPRMIGSSSEIKSNQKRSTAIDLQEAFNTSRLQKKDIPYCTTRLEANDSTKDCDMKPVASSPCEIYSLVVILGRANRRIKLQQTKCFTSLESLFTGGKSLIILMQISRWPLTHPSTYQTRPWRHSNRGLGKTSPWLDLNAKRHASTCSSHSPEPLGDAQQELFRSRFLSSRMYASDLYVCSRYPGGQVCPCN